MKQRYNFRFSITASLGILFVFILLSVPSTKFAQSAPLFSEEMMTGEVSRVDLTPTPDAEQSNAEMNGSALAPESELMVDPVTGAIFDPLEALGQTFADVSSFTNKVYLAWVAKNGQSELSQAVEPENTPTPENSPQIEVSPEPAMQEEDSSDSARIVGGVEAALGAWPWQARLSINLNGNTFLCGGSLVDAYWVVTAAHCLREGSSTAAASGVTVIMGDHNRTVAEASEQVLEVSQVIVHASYNASTNDNDIALLRLKRPATLTDRVRVIPLVASPQNDPLFAPGVNAMITGWGTTAEGGSVSNVLRQAQVPIVSNATCNAPTSYNGQITANMLCAGFAAGKVDTCQGDSGGPFVVRDGTSWRLAGITSWGNGCARANLYGVYTRVARFTSWVKSFIAPAGSFQIVALHSNKCLDVAGGTTATGNGVNVQQWECLGTQQTNQIWRLIPVGTNAFQIVAVHSGRCLDVTGGVGAVGNGANVQQWGCIGASQTNQLWRLVPVGDAFQIVAIHSGRCLDVAGGTGATGNGANVQQWGCLGAAQTNQLWQLVPYGDFQVVAKHSNKCLDVTGGTGAVANGTKAQQWACLGKAQTNQLWHLVRVANNRFQVMAVHSGKCLDVTGGTAAISNGVPTQQWDCLGTGQTNQIWRLVPIGNRFQLIALHSNRCLDVSGGISATANGTKVQQWDCLGAAQTNQLWELRRQ